MAVRRSVLDTGVHVCDNQCRVICDARSGEEPTGTMRFEWDEQKSKTNLAKHGLDFADAHRVFRLPMLVALDERVQYGEDRWIGIGLLDGRVVVLVYTERGEDAIRTISLRKALSHERKQVERHLKDRLGTG